MKTILQFPVIAIGVFAVIAAVIIMAVKYLREQWFIRTHFDKIKQEIDFILCGGEVDYVTLHNLLSDRGIHLSTSSLKSCLHKLKQDKLIIERTIPPDGPLEEDTIGHSYFYRLPLKREMELP